MRISDWSSDVCSSDLGDVALAHATGLRAAKKYQLFNGALECSLVVCDPVRPAVRDDAQPRALSEGAQMLANRLRKNLRNLKAWRARAGRSEERRVGKWCVSTCRSRGSPAKLKK